MTEPNAPNGAFRSPHPQGYMGLLQTTDDSSLETLAADRAPPETSRFHGVLPHSEFQNPGRLELPHGQAQSPSSLRQRSAGCVQGFPAGTGPRPFPPTPPFPSTGYRSPGPTGGLYLPRPPPSPGPPPLKESVNSLKRRYTLNDYQVVELMAMGKLHPRDQALEMLAIQMIARQELQEIRAYLERTWEVPAELAMDLHVAVYGKIFDPTAETYTIDVDQLYDRILSQQALIPDAVWRTEGVKRKTIAVISSYISNARSALKKKSTGVGKDRAKIDSPLEEYAKAIFKDKNSKKKLTEDHYRRAAFLRKFRKRYADRDFYAQVEAELMLMNLMDTQSRASAYDRMVPEDRRTFRDSDETGSPEASVQAGQGITLHRPQGPPTSEVNQDYDYYADAVAYGHYTYPPTVDPTSFQGDDGEDTD